MANSGPAEPPRRWFDPVRRWRERIRAWPAAHRVYRLVVGTLGLLVVALGLVLVPFPGPGWLIVIAGLAILGTEFEAARRLLRFTQRRLRAWTQWLGRQPLPIRLLVGLAALAATAVLAYGALLLTELPDWVPGSVSKWFGAAPVRYDQAVRSGAGTAGMLKGD
jgi:uncharacterized protein (TIGR02611 family)